MPRARREWSVIRTEIRRMIREVTPAYFSNDLLKDLWNHAQDLRSIQMANASEGWVTQTVKTDLVADQREYTLPENLGRILRVLLVRDDGQGPYEVPLYRDEKRQEALWHTTALGVGRASYAPTHRFEGELLILEPMPRESVTDGLHLQIESLPARFTGADTDKLARRWPDVLETLLIYDVVFLALGVEEGQGASAPGWSPPTRLTLMRDRYEGEFQTFIETRVEAPVAPVPYYLGD